MSLHSFRKTIIGVVILIGMALITIFYKGFGDPNSPTVNNSSSNDSIDLIATSPANFLEKKDIFIVPDQVLEFTFDTPLENVPETKIILDPSHTVKMELSGDKKTLKIIPEVPYKLDQGYTLVIKSETKFEGKKTLDKEYNFHFNTPSYSGI